jgi:hypothetical protein
VGPSPISNVHFPFRNIRREQAFRSRPTLPRITALTFMPLPLMRTRQVPSSTQNRRRVPEQ